MIKICEFCGLEFETTTGKQKYCKRDHYDTCVVCGSKFLVKPNMLTDKTRARCCSKKCSSILRKSTCNEKYGGNAPASSYTVQEKMKSTMLDRYGVEFAAQSSDFKSKIENTCLEKYGEDHWFKTEDGRKSLSDRWTPEYKENWKNKVEATNLKRYGVSSVLSSPEIRSKMHQTYFNKTGYAEPLSNPDVQAKITKTNLERYGVSRPIQSEEIMNKLESTNLERYGVTQIFASSKIQDKIKSTNLDRYGKETYFGSQDCIDRRRLSMQSKHGVDWISQSKEWKQSSMTNPDKIDNLMEFEKAPSEYIQTRFSSPPSLQQLANDLGCNSTTIGQYVIKYELQDSIRYIFSYMEEEVYEFLLSIDPNLKIERNTKKYIPPYELDIYIPQYRLAIECNPTSTHNSSLSMFYERGKGLSSDYHKKKSKLCQENDIFLFHIFGYEWTHKTDIIKSMIKNLLGKSTNKIYARNTTLQLIDGHTSRLFMDTNHRQGYAPAKIHLGLYYNSELVSVMTFGKMRSTIGAGKVHTDLDDCWELVRFCNKLDTNVVGGASKLFKHFLELSGVKHVRSFSDIAHTRGFLYSKLGFKYIHESNSGYVWVDTKTDIAYHRINAQKRNIRKFLNDESIDLTDTESNIMIEHGFVQVFDSGTILWEYK